MSILSNTHMMSSLSRGGATAVMEAARNGNPALVLKSNRPYRVITTVEDYERMSELEEDNFLLSMALARLENSGPIISDRLAYEELGIDLREIAEMEDVEIS